DNHPQPAQGGPPATDDTFINDRDAIDHSGDDDEDEEKPKSDKKAGRRKIKIEFIQDKSRRHITFSKRKAGVSFFNTFPLIHAYLTIPIYRYYEKGNISSFSIPIHHVVIIFLNLVIGL